MFAKRRDVKRSIVGWEGRRDRQVLGRAIAEAAIAELFSKPMVAVSLASAAMCVVIMSILGPLGTGATLGPLTCFLYWSLCGAMIWPLCHFTGAAMLNVLRLTRSLKLGLVLAAVATALYGGGASIPPLLVADAVFRSGVPGPDLGEAFAVATIILVACVTIASLALYLRIQHRFAGRSDGIDGAGGTSKRHFPCVDWSNGDGSKEIGQDEDFAATENAPKEFLNRLPSSLGSDLIYLRVDDHYLEVYTAKGHAELLMCMSDAVAALGDLGMQVHRSFWVARRHMLELRRVSGRHRLILTGGHKVPVSRTYVKAVRDALRSTGPNSRGVNWPRHRRVDPQFSL